MIGHVNARQILERDLPPAALLRGPRSIGKWTLARHLADHHRVAAIDRWEVQHGLTIDTVRLVSAYAARAPHGRFKVIIARLDEASRQALNALLKTLEEPPPRVRFLLISAGRPLETVASRCMVFDLGELSRAELEAVYRDQGMPTAKAHRAAAFARGSVDRGYDADRVAASRNQVVNLAKALATGDRDLFTGVFATWDGRCTDLWNTLLTECLTLRWTQFDEADTFGLHHDRLKLWRMVAAVTRLPAARPRLGVRAALEPFLSR